MRQSRNMRKQIKKKFVRYWKCKESYANGCCNLATAIIEIIFDIIAGEE